MVTPPYQEGSRICNGGAARFWEQSDRKAVHARFKKKIDFIVLGFEVKDLYVEWRLVYLWIKTFQVASCRFLVFYNKMRKWFHLIYYPFRNARTNSWFTKRNRNEVKRTFFHESGLKGVCFRRTSLKDLLCTFWIACLCQLNFQLFYRHVIQWHGLFYQFVNLC